MRGKERNSAFFNNQKAKPNASLQSRFKAARAHGTLSMTSCNPPLTSIPAEVFDLEKSIEEGEKFWEFEPLKSLDLSFNKITAIPNEVCNLVDCVSMKYRDNMIESLPDSLFEGCISLKHLDLGSNRISSLSGRVANLTYLKDLLLSSNNLTALPEELVDCASITTLDLQHNKIRALPQRRWNMPCLTTLNLAYNGLTSLPACLGDILTLETIHCNSNNLAALPDFSRLTMLKYLDASQNVLEQFPRLPRENSRNKLSHLILGYNRIAHIDIDALVHHKALAELLIHNNKLAEVPMEIEYISSLKIIDVSNNDLRDLPSSLGYMQNLQHIRAEGNPIKVIRQQMLLKPVNELKAHLRSRGPSLIEAAPMEEILAQQKMSPTGPRSPVAAPYDTNPISQYQTSPSAYSSDNSAAQSRAKAGAAQGKTPLNSASRAAASAQLADRVKFRIRDITSAALDLSGLSLSSLPADFVAAVLSVPLGPTLVTLSVAKNALQALPLQLNDLPSVRVLNISDNKLHTQMPPEVTVCDIPTITSIDVSKNELSGAALEALVCPRAPAHLCNLTDIVANNNPIRAIPTSLSYQRGLKVLRLSYCQLTSVENVDFRTLPGLVTLDLSNNKIESLGSSLNSALCLEYLNVENNNLHEIPAELAALPRLKVLLIAGNAQRTVRTTLLQQGSSKVIEYLRSRLPLDYRVPNGTTGAFSLPGEEAVSQRNAPPPPARSTGSAQRFAPPAQTDREEYVAQDRRGQAVRSAPAAPAGYDSFRAEMSTIESASFRGRDATQVTARGAPDNSMVGYNQPASSGYTRRVPPPEAHDPWDRSAPVRTASQIPAAVPAVSARDAWDHAQDGWGALESRGRAAPRAEPSSSHSAAYNMPQSRYARGGAASAAQSGGSVGSLLNPGADSAPVPARSGVRRSNF